MRVLVAHNLYRSGAPSGENAAVAEEIAALRAAGVAVEAYLPHSDDIPALSTMDKVGVALGPVANPAGLRALTGAIRAHRPDVLHLHNVFPQVSPWAVRRAHALGVPVVQTVHNYRHSCVAGFRFRDGGPCDSCVDRLLPVPAVVHGCYRGSRLQSAAMAAGQVVHRGTWRSVDAFLALTPFQVAELGRLGVPAGRITLRPTAVPDPGPPGPPGRNVLFAGRLDEMKGVHMLLSAWERSSPPPGARLRIVGSGPLLPFLRFSAGPEVDVLGPLDAAGVAAEMRAAALVALPSLWYEGQPRVLVEALAHGRPVLTTDVGGLADVGGPAGGSPANGSSTGGSPTGGFPAGGSPAGGSFGWTGPPAALADRLAVLRDPAALAAAGVAARARYLAVHTPAAALAALLAVYTRLTERSDHSGQGSTAPAAGPRPRRPAGGAADPGGRGGRAQRPDAGQLGPVAGDLPGAHELHL